MIFDLLAMRPIRFFLLGVLLFLWGSGELLADDAPLRPLGPEPHPYTTERGRVMVEFEPLNYAYDRHNPDRDHRRAQSFTVGLLVKYGLLDNLDIQIGSDLFIWEREKDFGTGERERRRGTGDLTLRAKLNLWGNDGDETALSVMPFLQLPTGNRNLRAGGVQGGVMLPFAWEFAEGWSLENTPSFAGIRNGADDGYVFEFGNILTLNREIVEGIDIYVEFECLVTSERDDPWAGFVGAGLTFTLDENTVIEPAIHFGVTRAAEDMIVSLVLVRRF